MSSSAQIAANQANAQKSTGPVTAPGKAASSQNNCKHACRGRFRLLPHENEEEFIDLGIELLNEHQPTTPTEEILVQSMAEHFWTMRRAQSFQCETLQDTTLPSHISNAKMSLWMRYEAQHERAFHKCHAELRKLREEKRKADIGFERQKQAAAAAASKQEAEAAQTRLATARAEALELDTEVKTIVQAPFPGQATFDLNDFKQIIQSALRTVAAEQTLKLAA